MADETVLTEEEEQFGAWVDELEADVMEAEAEADHEDEREEEQKVARKTEQFVTKEEFQIEKMEASFEKNASDEAKELFSIYRMGDESPAQLKRIMQLAVTKADETAKRKGVPEEEVERVASEKAAKMAQDEYGVGPISGGSSGKQTPEEVFDALRAQAKAGDTHAAFVLFNGLPATGGPSSPE